MALGMVPADPWPRGKVTHALYNLGPPSTGRGWGVSGFVRHGKGALGVGVGGGVLELLVILTRDGDSGPGVRFPLR
jgi:hypothetical protein